MENKAGKVFRLTIICFLLFFVASVVMKAYHINWLPADRINLVADVFSKREIKTQSKSKPTRQTKTSATQDAEVFELYKKPNLITNFYENKIALQSLMQKLQQLKNGENVKIRIAYFGDSMIEGDLLTKTLRELLQKEYGGYGVGFLPVYSQIGGFRTTASISGKGWQDVNFYDKSAKNLYFSGHKFYGNGSGIYTDKTISDNVAIEKSILFGKTDLQISALGQSFNTDGIDDVNRFMISKNPGNKIDLSVSSDGPVYGVSFESPKGIILDNFSFRGITGVELRKLDEEFLKSIQKNNHYDLIVFQYGVNLLFRPNDTDYSYYEKLIKPVYAKFKSSFPDADFMIVSSADRAFRYNGTYKTAIGLPNLLEIQAKLADENGFAFFNLFETMGGENSIVKWAEENPALANKDYVHPNHNGAEILGKKIFEAVKANFEKYKKQNTPKTNNIQE